MEPIRCEADKLVLREYEEPARVVPEASLRNYALASIASLIFAENGGKPDGHEQTYLSQFRPLLKDEGNWSRQLGIYTKNPAAADRALVSLGKTLNFKPVELLAIALALAVEEEPMIGRALAYVQAPVSGSRPTLGLLEMAFARYMEPGDGDWLAGTIISGNSVRTGVLDIANASAPIPEQALKLPGALALALQNKQYRWPGARLIQSEKNLKLPPSIKKLASAHAGALDAGDGQAALVIRNASRREARAIAAYIAGQVRRKALFIDVNEVELAGLGPLCVADDLLPVFEYELAPDQHQLIPEPAGYQGPRLVITGPDGHIDTRSGSVLNWTIPVPLPKERRKLWSSRLEDDRLADELARHHLHSAGRIHELAELAQRQARLNKRRQPNEQDFRDAGWLGEESDLSSLAQPIFNSVPDDALVLTENLEQELQQLVTRCRNRESLADDLGVTIKARYQTGVRALFLGASGTGKTLSASWLATRLGLPLYRVDLASVISKYIGETEENLAKLLAKAERSEIVLLFDEADALFGKRTDIKDANDRFANSQTNYLLQRIETYTGIVLLTSNSRSRFDSGFTRRLDKVIEFPLPGPGERRRLWYCHLGDKHELSTTQCNQLAVVSDLVGGHIRNAVLTAAVEAQARGRRIRFDDVVTGLAGEYRKLGRQLPVELSRARAEYLDSLVARLE